MVSGSIVCYAAARNVDGCTSRSARRHLRLAGIAALAVALGSAPASGSAGGEASSVATPDVDASGTAAQAAGPVVKISHEGSLVEVTLGALGGVEVLRAGPNEGAAAVQWDRPRLFAACEALTAELSLAPPFEGDVDAEGAAAEPIPPEPGESVDCAALALLVEQRVAATERAESDEMSLEAPITAAEPSASAAAVEAIAAQVDVLLAGAITLDVVAGGRRAGALTLEPDDVRAALRVVARGAPARLVAELRPELLEGKLPEHRGFRLDGAALFAAAGDAAKKADRKGTVTAAADTTSKKADALVQKGLVASYTTRYPKGQPRVTNIHRIVKLLDGAIVEPGDRFSLNQRAGKRTAKRGFVLAPSIGEGAIVETVGGGVSQVATTLYNAVFDAGYAVVSRKPHTRYFDRYPLGVEATLSWPRPDFVFRNDSKTGVLIRASVTEDSVTIKLYGDIEGRKVTRSVSKTFDPTDPRIDYDPDETMALDKTRVKDAGTKGFSVKAGRDIVFADGTKKHEERTVIYHGRPKVVVAHPCAIPKGEKGHRKKGCPKPPERVDGDAFYDSLAGEKDAKKAAAKDASAKDASAKDASAKEPKKAGGSKPRKGAAAKDAAPSKGSASKDKSAKKK